MRAFKENQRDSKARVEKIEGLEAELRAQRAAKVFDVDAFLTEAEMEALEAVAKEEDYFEDVGVFAVELADPVLVESTIAWVCADAHLNQRPDEEIARLRDEWEGQAA